MSLKNKSILITAGPTWVPIDAVRVLSNRASGETGFLLAEKLKQAGAKPTLLLGPVGCCRPIKNIRLLRFCFFDELKNLLIRELRTNRYDAVVHAAAVADYRPEKEIISKMSSGIRHWNLRLIPTIKLIDLF